MEMMARLYERSAFSVIGTKKSPVLKMENGRGVGVFPLEYVSWTKRLATFLPDFIAQVDAA